MRSLLIIAAFAGCSSNTDTSVTHPNTPAVEHPEWVTKGSGAFGGDTGTIAFDSAERPLVPPADTACTANR